MIWPDWLPFYGEMALGAATAAGVLGAGLASRMDRAQAAGSGRERRTERRLRPLEREGWTAVHDVLARRGNIDHIALGAKGAYALETKCLHGPVAFDSRGLVVRRRDDERDTWRTAVPLDRSLRGSAAALQRELSGAGVRWVRRVVVLWSDFDEDVREIGGTTYVHGSYLASWLRAQDD